MDPYFARRHRLNCVLCCDPQFTSCMIHKKESSVGALLEFYPQKRKTTAAITSAQTKKVSRELGSAGSFARLLPSKICTRPSAVHASDGKILCPFPSLTTVHRAAQPSGKEGEESQMLLLLSSHVSRKTATGRSLALSVAMVQPAEYSCSTVLTRCLASSIQAAHQKRSNPLS